MPIVEVTVGPRVDDSAIARLRDVLPEGVSLAVECPEEPYDGELSRETWRSTSDQSVSTTAAGSMC